jgi:hypothetical protein
VGQRGEQDGPFVSLVEPAREAPRIVSRGIQRLEVVRIGQRRARRAALCAAPFSVRAPSVEM